MVANSFKLPSDEIFLSLEHPLSSNRNDDHFFNEEAALRSGINLNDISTDTLLRTIDKHTSIEVYIVMKTAVYSIYEESGEIREMTMPHVAKKVS